MNETTETFIELHVPDFQIAIDFYKILGFKLVWVSAEYMVIKRRKSVLFFYGGDNKIYRHSYFGSFPKSTKRGYGVEIIIYEHNIASFYNRIRWKVKVVEKLQLRPWN